MTKQPLKIYLHKLVDYNYKNDVSTRFTYTTSFEYKHELIKRIKNINPNTRFQWKIFERYMNNSYWLWK